MQVYNIHGGAFVTVRLHAYVCVPLHTKTHMHQHYHNHSHSL